MVLYDYSGCGGWEFWLKFKQAEQECELGHQPESWKGETRKWGSSTEGNKQRNETLTVSKQLECCQFKSTKFKISNLGSSLPDQFEMNMFYLFVKNASFH